MRDPSIFLHPVKNCLLSDEGGSYHVWTVGSVCDEGGYSHAPDDLSYGVDMKKIRWCGILQVPDFKPNCVRFLQVLSINIGSSLLWSRE